MLNRQLFIGKAEFLSNSQMHHEVWYEIHHAVLPVQWYSSLTPPELQRQINLPACTALALCIWNSVDNHPGGCQDYKCIRRHLLGNELKLARSGILSTRGASPRSCDSGVMRMLQGSEAPYFEKKMTHPMLQRNERVLIPGSFIRTHGHMLDTVVSLTGPNGHTRSVKIKTYPQSGCRYLSHGWVEFVKENGLQTGDFVTFRLEGISRFHALVSELQEKTVFIALPLSRVLPKCDKESGLGNYGRQDDGIIPQFTKVYKRRHRKVTTIQATTGPKCEINVNLAETPVQPWHFVALDNMKDAAVIKNPSLRQTDYVKYPGLDSAISSNSRFPRFFSKLTRISRVVRLGLPIRFAKEHGHKFQARVVLRGPYGRWRMVKLKVSSTVRTSVRVQFRHGWRDFSQENGFHEGDVLLFSLVGLSKFVVQVFPEAKSLQ